MNEFPWNLPEEWLSDLPVNRELLAERYKTLVACLKNSEPDKERISSLVRQDPSSLSMMERGVLYQELLRVFGQDSGSGSGVPLKPSPSQGGSEIALPIPEAAREDQ